MGVTVKNYLNSRCSVCTTLIVPPGFCSTAALRQASDRHCATCTLLYTALSEKLDLNDPTIERVDSIGGYGFFNLAVGPAKPRFTTGSLWDHVSVTLALDGEGYCPPSLEWLPILKKSPMLRTKDRDIQLIQDRIEDCRNNHPNCPKSNPSCLGNLPTRVIDVGLDGKKPFLHLSQKGEKARYLALSHRWGDPKSSHKRLLTLKENVSTHCKGIPLEEFPKTFREAIEVARGLGIQYIWIDSICIIQNDEKDWETEASRMADVYSNAFATIFADRATHSDEGLFQNEKDRKTIRSLRFLDFKTEESEIPARVIVQTQIDPNTANFATEVHELFCQADQTPSQLSGRGWILQEECLSRRRIHFTETELKWKCPTLANCDCGLPTPPDMGDPTANFSILVKPEKAKKMPWKTPAWLWQQLVEHYTTRSLSFESDRMIALAGLASKVPAPRQDYLGGIWRKQLNTGILWEARGPCRRTAEYVAPSWSWASVSGKIRFVPLSRETRFIWEVIEAKCLFNGSDGDFGKVASAHLKVRSKVVQVNVEERQQNMRKEIAQNLWDEGDATWKIRGDRVNYLTVMPVQLPPGYPPPLPTVLELDVQSDWDVLTSGAQLESRLLCVALVDTFWEGYPAERALCLLLRRSPTETTSWERVCFVFLKGTWKSWEPYILDEELTIL
ncbi:HET-domain-containing protein [Annulohypoxylon maeteangense]|uniref:HET-domain-containing protein n=1 Tax=Annulohypoxylon maeteangense TaxID=1927788 RepID=UPI0020077857|nr:HET-domain-containing protein [Annulohypoxylon maeteangense]KAI0885409.1 HET-domain-containing protein [Annulohypoxylon maeteangense]